MADRRPTYQEWCEASHDPTYVDDHERWNDHWPQHEPKLDHGGLQVRGAPLNAWCGAAALSAACGISYDDAVSAIKVSNLRQYLKAVTYSEMRAALQQLDVPFTEEQPEVLVQDYLANCDDELTRLICVPVHWFVTRGNHWACSQNRDGRLLYNCPYLSSKALHVITLTESAPAHP